jgi:hypothetical protein
MNSQGGKASTQASGKSNQTRQTNVQSKAQKSNNNNNRNNNSSNNRRRNNNNNNRRNQGANLNNSVKSTGRLGLSSGNSSKLKKTHLLDEDEYIMDVNGSVAFATTSLPINPGQISTFPWGSRIASLYEKYQFTFLEFYYRREVSEFATNGQAGKVMLSVDFDASDSPPSTKQQVLDTEPHEDGMPCQEQIILRVDCRQMVRQDGMYVRPGAQPANTDIKTYDAGNFFVSTYGNTNTTTIGELRVRYKCLLSVPVLEGSGQGSGSAGSFAMFTSPLTGESSGATTVETVLLSTNPITIANGIGATITGGVVTIPQGSYLVTWSVTTTCSAVDASAVSTINNTATLATGELLQLLSTGDQFSTNSSTGHKSYGECSRSFILNTFLNGNTLSIHTTSTYASGTSSAQAYLSILQL